MSFNTQLIVEIICLHLNKQNEIKMELSNRLLSLDVFRGITIAAMIMVNNPGSWSYVYKPLGHAEMVVRLQI